MRSCDECNAMMMKGFVIEAGLEYYCSEECMHKHITNEEYMNLYNDGEGESYWTDWEYMNCDYCGKEETKGFVAKNSFYCGGTCLSASETGDNHEAAEFKILVEV